MVGAGAWGRNIIRTLDGLGALGGVAEVASSLRAAVAADLPHVPTFDDHKALLGSDVDAIAIATPVPTHATLALDAIAAGKDVFVEKPLALSVAEGERVTRAADRAGRVLMVGHMLLYQPAIAWLKDAIARGVVGELVSLHQERLNLGKARAGENALWSLGVHDVAVLLHLVGGTPVSSRAHGQRVLRSSIEDDVHLHMSFSGGVQAHLHASWLWPERRRRLTVIGREGMLVYDEIEQAVTLHRKRIDADLAIVDAGSEVVLRGAAEPLRLELEHFLACCRSRTAPVSDGDSGVAVVRVLEDAMRSLGGPEMRP